ncbi:hypothetical protein ACFLS9_07835 [Bacteroidota bacterium]
MQKKIDKIRRDNYDKVTDLMKGSFESEDLARSILSKKGFYVFPKFNKQITPTAKKKDIEANNDGCDLLIVKDGMIKIIEVKKHITVKHWTGRDNYPYDKVIVDAKQQFDNKPVRPHGYFIFNNTMSHFMFINVPNTINTWEIKRGKSPNGYKKNYYILDKSRVFFDDIQKYIQEAKN